MRGRGKASIAKATVAILYNQDYDVSLADYVARADVEKTAHAIAAGLDASDRFCAALVPVPAAPLAFIDTLRAMRPAAVFNLCESLDGNAKHESLVPAVLELLQLPYTGNEQLTLATALRKDRTKELLRAHHVPHPEALVVDRPMRQKPPFGFPAIVKPVREDGSLGISPASVVHNLAALNRQIVELMATYHQPVLVEHFIDGREFNVPLLGNDALERLPFSEVDFSGMPLSLPKIITYSGKWDEDSDEYRGSVTRVNPPLSAGLARKLWTAASGAFVALECSGYARVDLRLDPSGEPYVIDVNPNCDLSPQGGFFRACRSSGMTYSDMAARIVELALGKKKTHGSSRSPALAPRQGAA